MRNASCFMSKSLAHEVVMNLLLMVPPSKFDATLGFHHHIPHSMMENFLHNHPLVVQIC